MSDEPKPVDAVNAPAPEPLKVQDDSSAASETTETPVTTATSDQSVTVKHRIAYRPSHRATFIGLLVVSGILIANAVVIALVMQGKTDAADASAKNGITISSGVLDKLGVSRNPTGGANTELTVGPDSTFNGKVTVGGDVTVAGQLALNSKLSASDASLGKLQSGDTQVQKLNVNGDGTITSLNLRKDIQVAGSARLQGQLTVDQLTTINNNMNVIGNLSIGGALSVRSFQVGTLTVAGHLLSSGGAPGVSAGGAVGGSGTVSISGNDTSGTVAVNTGVGAGNGLLAQISFVQKYSNTPHVVVTPVGHSLPGMYINRTSSGFSISVDGGMAPAGYAFDYVVVQ